MFWSIMIKLIKTGKNQVNSIDIFIVKILESFSDKRII